MQATLVVLDLLAIQEMLEALETRASQDPEEIR